VIAAGMVKQRMPMGSRQARTEEDVCRCWRLVISKSIQAAGFQTVKAACERLVTGYAALVASELRGCCPDAVVIRSLLASAWRG